MRRLASPRPPVPTVAELIARYEQFRLPEPVADFVVPELCELAAEVEDRHGELTENARRYWHELIAAHPAPLRGETNLGN